MLAISTFLVFLAGCAAIVLLVPSLVLFLEVILSLDGNEELEQTTQERPRLAVLMPAHNEASIIAMSLRTIMPQLADTDRMLVVADNCSDETRTIAESEGAEVISRSDLVRRGKGYALDFGVRHLARDPPDIVIIIDADCLVAIGTIDKLAYLSAQTRRPVQALYLMLAAAGAGVNLRLAQFAFLLKNLVRPTGLHRLGLPCQLMGTGMAFSWACISTAPLATGHIVEDLKLGIELARRGEFPLFCPDALVTSKFATSNEGIRSQRTRWEHGHIAVILSDGPRLLLDSIARLDVRLMSMALDLAVPPLSLLVLANVVVWVAGGILLVFTKAAIPLTFSTMSLCLLTLSVFLSWRRFGRHLISIVDLGLAMYYAIMKIPLYVRFLITRQLEWVRSKRDGE
jgi:cellulose synthase/poly-beta-1,6-N-acetylglucosamine synthase-like glycosyltransferase